jgi:hypothetical protein
VSPVLRELAAAALIAAGLLAWAWWYPDLVRLAFSR